MKNSENRLTRRSFLKTAAAAAGAALVHSSINDEQAQAANEPRRENLHHYQRPVGDPYELLGKRLVFTNWLFVRQGVFNWSKDGQSLFVVGSAGPWDAEFSRTSDFPYGIKITSRKAKKVGPVIKPEHEKEEPKGYLLSTILQDNGKYRAWMGSSYLESKDGMDWKRPNLGIGERNSLGISFLSGTVFKDLAAPSDERYKWAGDISVSEETLQKFMQKYPDNWESRAVGHNRVIGGYVSPDGLHWKMLEEPLVAEHSDTHIVGYYDVQRRKYVLYTRKHMLGYRSNIGSERHSAYWEIGRRCIGRSESDTFGNFQVSEYILVPSPQMQPYDLLYTNCRTSIPGAPDLHLMFPAVWHLIDDTTSILMASSFDGVVWDYIPGGYVFETSSFGEWDGGCIFACPNLIELPNGDFALPYNGYIFPHKYSRGQWKVAVGYAVWPKGRIVALEAPERGQFSTVPFIPPGRKIHINADTKRAGSILVEVHDYNGVIKGRSFGDCDPIIGDQFKKTITWKGESDLGVSENSPVILHFKLDRASIYSLDFV